jgi:ferredoxin
MPTVSFEGNAIAPAISVDAEGGGPLVDLCDSAGAPVALSCRSASCAVCRVEVLAGRELLEPPRDDEAALLQLFDAPPSQRLACQAVVRSGPGLLRLRGVVDGV